MKLKFKIVIKLGQKVLAEVNGLERDPAGLQVGDITDIVETEQHLKRLLGLRVHIETGD